jgi:hypothetical protein
MNTDVYIHNPPNQNEDKPTAAEKIDWEKILKDNWLWIILAVLSIVTSTLLLNFFLDYNITTSKIYAIAIISIVALAFMTLYQSKQDGSKKLTTLISVYKTQLIVILISLPLITGVFGYSLNHYFSFKNEKYQKNEIVRVEREKAHGMEAEIITAMKIKGKIYPAGYRFPVATVDNSAQQTQNGPYKFISIYLPNDEKIQIKLDHVTIGPKTIKLKGYDIIPGEKTKKIIFTTSEKVIVMENWQAGQQIKISGYGDDEIYFRDGGRLAKIPTSGIITSAINQPLEITYKKGGIIYISS